MSLQSILAHLDQLIAHERTGDGERAAAQLKREVILERIEFNNAKEVAEADYDRYFPNPRVYGAKAQEHRFTDLKVIKQMIINDIKLAIKLAQVESKSGTDLAMPEPLAVFPKRAKITGRSSYGGGGSIDIILRGLDPAWAWTQEEDKYRPGIFHTVASEELRALGRTMKDYYSAYNWDGSDVQSDYFDVNYYGGINAIDESGYPRRIDSGW